MNRCPVPWCLAALLLAALPARAAAEWPLYRADPQRRGYAPGSLPGVPRWIWTHQPALPPAPAWPEPARRSYWQQLESITPRVIDDHAFHPVLADGRIVFGSSADDTVRCLALDDGRPLWTFTADGPVRYAPALAGDRVWFGSDDGRVYCLQADEGRLLWSRRLAPTDRRIPGNGRLISAWPVRTGVLVLDGTVHAFAGLYPQQGVWGARLAADTGDVLSQQAYDFSPQGYLLASTDWIYVPTGRGNPVAVARATGKPGRTFDGPGGNFAVVTDEELVTGRGNDASLASLASDTGERLAQYAAGQLVAAPQHSYLLGRGHLIALDRRRHADLGRQLRQLQAEVQELQARLRRLPAGDPQITAGRNRLKELGTTIDAVERGREACRRWSVPCPLQGALAAVDDVVVAGGTNALWGIATDTGEVRWRVALDGEVLGLAIAGDTLVASTAQGGLWCFKADRHDATAAANPTDLPSTPVPRAAPTPTPTAPPVAATRRESVRRFVERALVDGLPRTGIALVAGLEDGQLLEALTQATSLTVVGMDPDPGRVADLRRRFLALGLYGRRIAVHAVEPGTLPCTDYLANAVLSETGMTSDAPLPWPETELHRVLRPFGGYGHWNLSQAPLRRGPLEGAGTWSHQYANPANTANSGDALTTANLALQWFGGPGPRRMVDRHLRGPAPLCAGGRLFVAGENLLIAVDAYNGTPLWECELPGSQRYSMPYDAGYLSTDGTRLAVAVRDACWIVDAATGTVQRRLPVPVTGWPTEGLERHWGFVALHHDAVFGSVQWPTASRTQPGRDQVHHDYLSAQPLVTSRTVFRADPVSGATQWSHGPATILNSTLTLSTDAVLFVENPRTDLPAAPEGRVSLASFLPEARLVCLDARTGTPRWEAPIPDGLRACRNVVFLQADAERCLLSGSVMGGNDDADYRLACFDLATGRLRWEAGHAKGMPGAHYHGEQVHHPVLLGDLVVAEPAIYDLATGRRRATAEGTEPWRLVRPGHSCGTLSGAGTCLFFRANHPNVWDIGRSLSAGDGPRALAPTRPGCWINIIPAGGLVLIPEASAGCVCNYSLQTSMAFLPLQP